MAEQATCQGPSAALLVHRRGGERSGGSPRGGASAGLRRVFRGIGGAAGDDNAARTAAVARCAALVCPDCGGCGRDHSAAWISFACVFHGGACHGWSRCASGGACGWRGVPCKARPFGIGCTGSSGRCCACSNGCCACACCSCRTCSSSTCRRCARGSGSSAASTCRTGTCPACTCRSYGCACSSGPCCRNGPCASYIPGADYGYHGTRARC